MTARLLAALRRLLPRRSAPEAAAPLALDGVDDLRAATGDRPSIDRGYADRPAETWDADYARAQREARKVRRRRADR